MCLGMNAHKQLFMGIQNKEFRVNRISHLKGRPKWGFWAICGDCIRLIGLSGYTESTSKTYSV